MLTILVLVAVLQIANLIKTHKLGKRIVKMGISQDDAVIRLDALTARAGKILGEVQAVKQALIDLRNAQGNQPFKPETEAALVRAEEAVGRIDDVDDDADPTGAGTTGGTDTGSTTTEPTA